MEAKDRIIVALDVSTMEEAVNLASKLECQVGLCKVGLELLTDQGGPNVVGTIGRQVFYDGKFNDIPEIVSQASRSVTRMGVQMFDVHCLGGFEMMQAAKEAAKEEAALMSIEPPKVLGVTILTSLDFPAMHRLGMVGSQEGYNIFVNSQSNNGKGWITQKVVHLAKLAKEAGLDGVIASAKETEAIHQTCGDDFLVINPGIRPSWAAKGDQKRITTPSEAICYGADYLVIGRPIIDPPPEIRSPSEAVQLIIEEIEDAQHQHPAYCDCRKCLARD